ncbi:MAG: hypothetical protein ABH830_04115 [Patescibacteria group bacterium]
MKKLLAGCFFFGLFVLGAVIVAHRGGAGPEISWPLIKLPLVFWAASFLIITLKYQLKRDKNNLVLRRRTLL